MVLLIITTFEYRRGLIFRHIHITPPNNGLCPPPPCLPVSCFINNRQYTALSYNWQPWLGFHLFCLLLLFNPKTPPPHPPLLFKCVVLLIFYSLDLKQFKSRKHQVRKLTIIYSLNISCMHIVYFDHFFPHCQLLILLDPFSHKALPTVCTFFFLISRVQLILCMWAQCRTRGCMGNLPGATTLTKTDFPTSSSLQLRVGSHESPPPVMLT